MNNTNIALAYINEMGNPLKVFCNLLIYVLSKGDNQTLRIDEVKEAILKEFGLKVPSHIIKACTKILKKNYDIEILKNGGGYKFRKSNFDIKRFESELIQRKVREENLIKDLQEYLTEMDIELTIDEARKKFIDFLIASNYAYSLFSNGSTESIKFDRKIISSEWYISQYIKKIEREKSSNFDYILDIVKGLMIYIGLCQFSDFNQEREEKFRGTSFYLDTKMMLRYLGYSWPELVEETRELVDLIRKDYKGNICIFEHTYSEISSALSNEIFVLKNGGQENYELRCFRILKKYRKEKFEIDLKKLEDKIKEEKIEIKQDVDIKTDKNLHYNLDYNAFCEYIHENYPNWKENAIYNDVHSINQIHVMRRGNYSKIFGGKQKLPIFVTTNYSLIASCRKCLRDEYQKKEKDFVFDNLPVIADSALMYRLWLPKASQIKNNMPALSLSRIVYTAQQENEAFYVKFKAMIKDYKEYNNITLEDLSEVYSSKLFEITAKNAKGNYENFTDEILAQSLEEFIAIQLSQKDEEISELKTQVQDGEKEKINDREEWIEVYTEKFLKNRLLIGRIFCFISRYWWLLSGVLVVVISELLNHFTNQASSIVLFSRIIGILLFLKPYFLKVLDKLANKKVDRVTAYFKHLAQKSLDKSFDKIFDSKSNKRALEYKEDILNKSFKILKIEK